MQRINIEYGKGHLEVELPVRADIAGMSNPPAPLKGETAFREALQNPVGSPSLLSIAREKISGNHAAKAVIVVSDNTRPVPYKGRDGMIIPLIQTLMEGGFPQSQITILIGAGSHRNMEADEIEHMLGLNEAGLSGVTVVNHEYENPEHLAFLGKTRAGSTVMINRLYVDADLKIVTGLVESHFMAGASGGRKGICPGIVGKETLNIFHGAKFLSSSMAADMILDGNPLHDESLEVALMAGCDFLVNTTIDGDKNLTGVFAGDLQAAHKAAVGFIRTYVMVPISEQYDIVIIPAGFVGVNHYQAAKAAIEASRAVKKGGKIILIARETDPDPVGGEGYKEALRLLHDKGRDTFLEMILAPDWKMIQEQWEVQMWCKVFEIIEDESNFIYCSLVIPEDAWEYLPGRAGTKLIDNDSPEEEEVRMKKMILEALDISLSESHSENPSVVFLKDGPYGIPGVLETAQNQGI